MLAWPAVIVLAGCGGSAKPSAPAGPSPVARDVAPASQLCEPGEGASLYQAQVCLQRRLLAVVSGAGGPAAALPVVDTR